MIMKTWLAARSGEVTVPEISRRLRRKTFQTQAQNNWYIEEMCIFRDHDNRNNSIKRSGILFSWTERRGGVMKTKINWECCNATAAAATIKTIGQCVPFEQDWYCSQQIAILAGKWQKRWKKEGKKSFPVSILGHPSTFTLNWDGCRQGDGTVTDIAGWFLHFHKRVHILKSHPREEVRQLKVTDLKSEEPQDAYGVLQQPLKYHLSAI